MLSNSKFEYRNTKQIPNSNSPMFKTIAVVQLTSSYYFGHWNFEHSDLFRASCLPCSSRAWAVMQDYTGFVFFARRLQRKGS